MHPIQYTEKVNISPNDTLVLGSVGETLILQWGPTIEAAQGGPSESHFIGYFSSLAELLSAENAGIGKWAAIEFPDILVLVCCYSIPTNTPTAWVAMVHSPVPVPPVQQP